MGPAYSDLFSPMASLGPNIIYVGSSDALVWAQRSQNFFHRWRRLGPTFSLAGTPDTLVWAKCIQNYFHQWHRLGPTFSLAGAHDALEWARRIQNYIHRRCRLGPSLSQRVPPMPWYGPSAFRSTSNDAVAWAQHHLSGFLRCPSMCPTLFNLFSPIVTGTRVALDYGA